MRRFIYLFGLVAILWACEKGDDLDPFKPGGNPGGGTTNPVNPPDTNPVLPRPASIGVVGDTTDIKTQTKLGIVIMGGGTDVDAAFKWMIERSGGGNAVIIRASGTDAYNSYVKKLGQISSVETLKIDSKTLANNEGVATIIRNAELLFIAGGDQSDYTTYWKNTKVSAVIDYLVQVKKIPVGGTSAGAAILGNYYYSGEKSSVVSADALINPYDKNITLGKDDFIKAPYLENVITDQHFSQREREGRMLVFLGRIMKDWDKKVNGVAVDEKTAVCIDENGFAEVLGSNSAFFLKSNGSKKPEQVESGKPFTWNWEGQAVEVTEVSAKSKGNLFNMVSFEPENSLGVNQYWWSVINGKMYSNLIVK